MIKKKYPLVMAEWEDANSKTSWHIDDASKHNSATIQSVGWKVKSNPKTLTLAISHDDDNGISDCLTIPRGCINKITKIKVP